MYSVIPGPNEVHPAYRGETRLTDWLDDQALRAGYTVLRLPFVRRVSTTPDGCQSMSFGEHRLTRYRAWGPIEFDTDGRRYVRTWNVAHDELGRSVSGSAVVELLDEP